MLEYHGQVEVNLLNFQHIKLNHPKMYDFDYLNMNYMMNRVDSEDHKLCLLIDYDQYDLDLNDFGVFVHHFFLFLLDEDYYIFAISIFSLDLFYDVLIWQILVLNKTHDHIDRDYHHQNI